MADMLTHSLTQSTTKSLTLGAEAYAKAAEVDFKEAAVQLELLKQAIPPTDKEAMEQLARILPPRKPKSEKTDTNKRVKNESKVNKESKAAEKTLDKNANDAERDSRGALKAKTLLLIQEKLRSLGDKRQGGQAALDELNKEFDMLGQANLIDDSLTYLVNNNSDPELKASLEATQDEFRLKNARSIATGRDMHSIFRDLDLHPSEAFKLFLFISDPNNSVHDIHAALMKTIPNFNDYIKELKVELHTVGTIVKIPNIERALLINACQGGNKIKAICALLNAARKSEKRAKNEMARLPDPNVAAAA